MLSNFDFNVYFLIILAKMLSDIPKLEKANMLLLSKEMTDKDKSMKTQLLYKPKEDKLSGEKIWKEDGFFKDVEQN